MHAGGSMAGQRMKEAVGLGEKLSSKDEQLTAKCRRQLCGNSLTTADIEQVAAVRTRDTSSLVLYIIWARHLDRALIRL